MTRKGELYGLVVVDNNLSPFAKSVVAMCKFHQIANVGVMDFVYPPIASNAMEYFYWLDPDKEYVPYMEVPITYACNLNCKSCGAFSPLFKEGECYDLNQFNKDMRCLSEKVDICTLRFLGGEPFKTKNLDKYLESVRKHFPKTNIRIVSNGLLIPSLPQHILDAVREYRATINISFYKPTQKIFDKIENVLQKNGIAYQHNESVEVFFKNKNLKGDSNPVVAASRCNSPNCRYLFNSRLHKCPADALMFRFAEFFKIKNLPQPQSIDIYAQNFVSLLQRLEGTIEMCKFCSENPVIWNWEAPSKLKLNEWVV